MLKNNTISLELVEDIPTRATLTIQKGDRLYRYPTTLCRTKGRIEFLASPFALKDTIKGMAGSRWHGFSDGRKIWSVSDGPRNLFQLDYMSGNDPYAWFDRPLVAVDFGDDTTLMNHQKQMIQSGLTYHYQIWGAGLGTGKTLAAIEVIKRSDHDDWWWVGPKSSFYGIRQEFDKWGLDSNRISKMLSYESVQRALSDWKSGDKAPGGVIYDESHRLKTPSSQRTQACQRLADCIREEHGMAGYVILMTGTPSPKRPSDWWAQAEIAYPGFIAEGSKIAMEHRLAFFEEKEVQGQTFQAMKTWKDNTKKCAACGSLADTNGVCDCGVFRESVNEVALLYDRLKGLAVIIHKEDVLDLPPVQFKTLTLEPTASVLRVAGTIAKTAVNTITGITRLRELSDGFLYQDVADGTIACPGCSGTGKQVTYNHPKFGHVYTTDGLDQDFISVLTEVEGPCHACKGAGTKQNTKREIREVPCPKIDAVIDILADQEDQGRVVMFAGFTGSLERLVTTAQNAGWDTMRVDGRGWAIQKTNGEVVRLDNPMDYWIDPANSKVAFIAHPKSGGVSLTLCEQEGRPGARVAIFYSNDFDPASRVQAEGRIDRLGMIGFATIIDLLHLPTDSRVREVLKQNRKLELMTMGTFIADYA